MNTTLAFLGAIFLSFVTYAGSYAYDCAGYRVDSKTNEIYKIQFSREDAKYESYPGVTIENRDPNADLFTDALTFEGGHDNFFLTISVKPESTILNLTGFVGKRQKDVTITAVKMQVKQDSEILNFNGTCTETTVSTCGGSCEQE